MTQICRDSARLVAELGISVASQLRNKLACCWSTLLDAHWVNTIRKLQQGRRETVTMQAASPFAHVPQVDFMLRHLS